MRAHPWLVFLAVIALAAQLGAATGPATLAQRWPVAVPGASLDLGLGDAFRDAGDGPLGPVGQALWQMLRFVYRSIELWSQWLVRGLFFVAIAILVGLLDRHLLVAWRREGIRVIGTYVPMMLYVYVRLFFDRRLRLFAKIFLGAGIVYGVSVYDLIPDNDFFPGYVEDVFFIAVAMRFFLYCSPAASIEEYASQAVNIRRRVADLSAKTDLR